MLPIAQAVQHSERTIGLHCLHKELARAWLCESAQRATGFHPDSRCEVLQHVASCSKSALLYSLMCTAHARCVRAFYLRGELPVLDELSVESGVACVYDGVSCCGQVVSGLRVAHEVLGAGEVHFACLCDTDEEQAGAVVT